MKIFKTTLCCCIAAAIASCSSDDPAPGLQPNLPGNNEVHVQRITHSGNIEGCYDWTFAYNGTRLAAAVGCLYNPTSVDIEYTSNLYYGPTTVSIANTGNLSMEVSLDANYHITYLTVNKDEYRFIYNEGRLTQWEKSVKDVNFGAEVSRARGYIEYENGDLKTITYSENNDDPTIYYCTPSTTFNTNGLLPEMISKQLGCFGFEHLYYAGLLGKATRHMVKTIQVDYPEESNMQDYELNFNYATNKEGQIKLCTFIVNGEAASTNYEY